MYNQSPQQSPARWLGSAHRRLLSGHISGASHYLLAEKCCEFSAANKTFLSPLRSTTAASDQGEIIQVWFTAVAKNSSNLIKVWAGNTVYGHIAVSPRVVSEKKKLFLNLLCGSFVVVTVMKTLALMNKGLDEICEAETSAKVAQQPCLPWCLPAGSAVSAGQLRWPQTAASSPRPLSCAATSRGQHCTRRTSCISPPRLWGCCPAGCTDTRAMTIKMQIWLLFWKMHKFEIHYLFIYFC